MRRNVWGSARASVAAEAVAHPLSHSTNYDPQEPQTRTQLDRSFYCGIEKLAGSLRRTFLCWHTFTRRPMALLDKLKQELDRAGKVAQDAFDDGKTRLEAFRTRQLADKAAQGLGYAVYRARKSGGELDAATYDRLRATLETHDTEAARLEAEIELRRQQYTTSPSATQSTTQTGSTADSTEAYPAPPS